MSDKRSDLTHRVASLSWRLAKPCVSLRWHLRALGRTLFCPVYHTVRDTPPLWWGGRYPIRSRAEFERDLDLLLAIAEPVDLQQLLAWQRGRAEKPAGWFLSFDDGYRELHDMAAPILLRKGIPATFFLCSSLIDNKRPFFEDVANLIAGRLNQCTAAERAQVERILQHHGRSILQFLNSRKPQFDLLYEVAGVLEIDVDSWLNLEQPYITSSQIRSLLANGFAVGAHGVDHALFEQIPAARQRAQLETSMIEISQNFGLDYRVFAFPYGEFGLTREFLAGILREKLVDICFGTRGVTVDELEPGLVQRMLAEDHRHSFGSHLKNELNLQLRRRSQGRPVVRRSG